MVDVPGDTVPFSPALTISIAAQSSQTIAFGLVAEGIYFNASPDTVTVYTDDVPTAALDSVLVVRDCLHESGGSSSAAPSSVPAPSSVQTSSLSAAVAPPDAAASGLTPTSGSLARTGSDTEATILSGVVIVASGLSLLILSWLWKSRGAHS